MKNIKTTTNQPPTNVVGASLLLSAKHDRVETKMESEATSQTSKQTTIVVIFQEPIEKFFRPPEPEGTHEPRNRFPGNSPTKRRNKSTVSLGNNVAS
jgi:hypothetical protein